MLTNDLITEINHQPVKNSEDLIHYLRKLKVGDKVTLLVIRNGNPVAISLTLGEKPAP